MDVNRVGRGGGLFIWRRLEPVGGYRVEEWQRREGMGVRRERGGEGGAQVLLLMDPGAELDWAGLSDTLPSCEAGDVCARA